MKRHDIVNN